MKEQIEEMTNVIQHSFQMLLPHDMAIVSAEYLYNAGYRKQKEGEWEYEVNHFFDDYGDLIVYVIAHCAECKTPYRDNSNVDYQRIERPEDLDAYAEWNIAVEPIKKAILERAKERKLSHHFCPNCGARMSGGKNE